ncbi:hypothetical protein ACNKHL_06425 [Shigella flexneri]
MLAAASDLMLQGARRLRVRKPCQFVKAGAFLTADSLSSLAASCDVVFCNSSTASHFDVVSNVTQCGCTCRVDKPRQKICAMLNGWNWRRVKN